jgi:hypothetical protein
MALIVVFGLLLPWTPARAEGYARALTHYALVVYGGPDRATPIVGVLVPETEVFIEAHGPDRAWVLGHTADGRVRGWVENRFLDYASLNELEALPESAEAMFVPGDTPSNPSLKTIDLDAYPIIPATMGRAREIFERGRANGTDPWAIARIGDCISDNRQFLSPFGWGQYQLGVYTQLQPVVDTFGKSMTFDSLAAYDGLVTSAVLDPVFANPMACRPGETPLRCEYRVHNPSVAIIMFGAQDLLFTPPDQFERNLRQIIHETIQAGIVPILSTFPGNLKMWDKSIHYNQIVVQVALDYEIPLMNLWTALEALPNHGLNEDGRHLSPPITDSGDLTGENLTRGYPLRNLITLQALDAVWRGAMY